MQGGATKSLMPFHRVGSRHRTGPTRHVGLLGLLALTIAASATAGCLAATPSPITADTPAASTAPLTPVADAAASPEASARPRPTRTGALATSASTSTTSSTSPAAPEDVPDDAGYLVSPASALDNSAVYLPMETGPAGDFLLELQEKLAGGDVPWVVSTIAVGGNDPKAGAIRFLALDGEKIETWRPASAVAELLKELLAAGSQPVVQGYFASRGEEPISVSFDDASDVATIDTIDVAMAGWRGATAAFGDATAEAPQAAIWRFERRGEAWHWRSWRWSSKGSYRDTVAAAEEILDDPREHRYTAYHVVRPADRWPTPEAELLRSVPSPDGQWVAHELSGEGQQIDPRDPVSSMTYDGVELVHEPSGARWRPIERWQNGGIGSSSPQVLGWASNSSAVVLDELTCGDGCVLHCGHALFAFDTATQSTRALPNIGYDATLDPTGRFVAGLGGVGSTDSAFLVRVLDIATASVISAAFAAEEAGSLVWAPDGSAVIFSVADGYETCAEFPASHLARFDVATAQLTELTPVDSAYRRVTGWTEDGKIEVAVYDDGAVWFDRPPDRVEIRDAKSGREATP